MTIKSRMKVPPNGPDGAAADVDADPREPLPVPPGGWPPDEFTGQAGRFVRDPFTGKRSRAPDEDEPAPAVA